MHVELRCPRRFAAARGLCLPMLLAVVPALAATIPLAVVAQDSSSNAARSAGAEPDANPKPAAKPEEGAKPIDDQVGAAESRRVQELAATLKKSVVVVTFTGRTGKQEGLGTGFVVGADGLIATNLHVIGEARPIFVTTADGKKHDVLAVHATQKSHDLALLKIAAKDLVPLPLADSSKLAQGAPVVAIGNPHGLEHSVVSGVVSGRREVDGKPMIQLAIPIEPGNSGGPLVDLDGRVHGILTMKSLVTRNLGFAVESNALKPLLEKPNPVPIARWLTIGALDPQEWTPLFGADWRQRAGRLNVRGTGEGFGGRSLCLWLGEVPDEPFELAVSVKLDAEDGAAGLVFRSDGKDRHYGFYPTNGRLRLSRFEGPDVFSWQVLREVQSPAYVAGGWNDLKVRVEKGKITGWVNDVLVVESDDAALPAGRVGLAKFRDTQAEFRGFRVAAKIDSDRPDAETTTRIAKLVADISPTRPPEDGLVEKLAGETVGSRLVLRERARLLEQQATRLRQLEQAVRTQRIQAELVRIFEKADADVDLARAALLVSQLDNEEVDVDGYVREIDRIVAGIRAKLPADADGAAKFAALDRHLFEELGFHGSRTDYYNKSNSYLNEVLDDREGLPITLSLLYIEAARRLGLRVAGVGLPGHFVVRREPPGAEPQLVDVFDRGRTMTRDDAAKLVRESTGSDIRDEHLAPQTKRAIVVRILHNLFGAARDAQDTESMLRYVDTIVKLDEQAAEDRWFRAVLRFQTQRLDEAKADTEWLLAHEPAGINLPRVRELHRILDEQTLRPDRRSP